MEPVPLALACFRDLGHQGSRLTLPVLGVGELGVAVASLLA